MKTNTNTFNISTTLDNGEKVEGVFTHKRLSIKDRSLMGARKSELGQGRYCVRDDDGNPTGVGLDAETDTINEIIAHLETSLIQKPEWFDLDNLEDTNVLLEVYEKVQKFENSFFRPKRDGNSGGNGSMGERNSDSKSSGEQSGSQPTQVVGEEVQAALDA